MAEPTVQVQVQVPVSLIERAPHDQRCASFSWNGAGWDNDPAACNCWKVEALSQPTPSAEAEALGRYHEALKRGLSDAEAREEGWPPTAPPSIADMVPGTTFMAATRVPLSSTPDKPDRWTVLDNGSAECERHGAVFTADEFDPSTIRDVTPPSVTS